MQKITAPILLMGYCNPLIAYGGDCFLYDALEAGVDGLLIPDLPPEEAADFLEKAKGFGLTVVFLVSPVTPPERIELIDSLSTDFSYCLASIGSGLFCFAFKTADGIRSLFQAKFKVCYVVKGALQSRFNPFMQDTFEHSLPVAH